MSFPQKEPVSPHYIALVCSYAAVISLWFVLNRVWPSLWRLRPSLTFARPAREFGYALIALIAVLGIGQLYVRDWMLPGDDVVILDAINHFLIFSPVLILLWLRKQGAATVWLPLDRVPQRLLCGLALALIALTVYWLTRRNAHGWGQIVANVYHPQNFALAVQVFMEDLAIALLFVRLAAWIGQRWSIALVAILFAAGHVPSLLAEGAALAELGSLFIDAFLGIIVLTALSRSRDIWWFFMVHFALDMTQFYGGS
ncbi:MAG: hypothetical protein R3301_10785 [Saprospiraceae bacterium]|nr:hypothetical protein [Saprospiraceae bacterium]